MKVTPSGSVSTVAGTGTAGYSGDGGPATRAMLNSPQTLALDQAGLLYIADLQHRVVRRVTPDGIIARVVGAGPIPSPTDYDGIPATQLFIDYPNGIAAYTLRAPGISDRDPPSDGLFTAASRL